MLAEILFQLFFDLAFLSMPFIYLYHFRGMRSLRDFSGALMLKFRSPGKDLVSTFSLFILLFAVSIVISIAMSFVLPGDAQGITDVIAEIVSMPALFIIYLFIIRIAVEEVFFRGFLMKYSQDWLSGLLPKSRIFAPHYGVLFSSAIFGLMHFAYGSFIEILGAFILGIILCLAAQRNGTIIPNIFAHMLYNALVVCLAVSAVF